MPALADVPLRAKDSEERRVFLSRRVAGFGRIIATFVFGFFVLSNGVGMLHPKASWGDWIAPQNLLVVAAGAIPFLVWVLCRNGRRSQAELETIDALSTITIGGLIGLASIHAPPVQRPELSSVTGAIVFVILRAIIVPSSGPRSAVLSSLACLPAIYGAYACHANEEPAAYTFPLFLYPALTAVWAALGVVAATLASQTIFGLRRRVTEAQRLGQYTLGEKIGEGGMGTVYRASHALMKREVAIKLLPPDKTGKDALVRFEREVQLTSRLHSPNTIQIFDYGRTPEGVFYYVMEYIDGFSLEDLVGCFGPLSPGRVVQIVAQIAGALAEAHAIGLVHRDIKPANVALCERAGAHDVVKVLDFGLVKELGTDVEATATALLTGTPLYLSPEAITAPGSLDGRSDLYAVGAVAYFLLTGTHVFSGSTIVEVCSHHLHRVPERPSHRIGRSLPRDVEDIVMRCLEKERDGRFLDAKSLREALEACDCAEEWTEELAADWWRTHRARAEGARPRRFDASRPAGPLTVELAEPQAILESMDAASTRRSAEARTVARHPERSAS